MRRAAAVVVLLGALGGTPAAAACPRTSLADLEDEVMCPVCGTPLELATEAPQAQREREYIQRLVNECRSKQQIKDALVAQFGDKVLAVPDDKGFDLAAYVVPAAAIALAAAAVGLAALRWRRIRSGRAGEGPAGAEAPTAGAAAARLDEDMRRYDL